MSLLVLVTGANGFVGKAVSRALLRRGDRVVGDPELMNRFGRLRAKV
ncbi:NAD-dependent epimerase/dehydratase family protein, partial [Paraburkholderia sp. Ac-20336]